MPVSSLESGTVTTRASGRAVTWRSLELPSMRSPAGPTAMNETCAGARALRAAPAAAGRVASRRRDSRRVVFLFIMVDSSARGVRRGGPPFIARSGELPSEPHPEPHLSPEGRRARGIRAPGRIQVVRLVRERSPEEEAEEVRQLP